MRAHTVAVLIKFPRWVKCAPTASHCVITLSPMFTASVSKNTKTPFGGTIECKPNFLRQFPRDCYYRGWG